MPTDTPAKGFFFLHSSPPTVADVIEPYRQLDDAGIPKHTVPEAVYYILQAFQEVCTENAELREKMAEGVALAQQLLAEDDKIRSDMRETCEAFTKQEDRSVEQRNRIYELEARNADLERRNAKLAEQLKYANEHLPDVCWTCGTKP